MKMVSLKFSKEIKDLIYVIIVLGIIFGFNDGGSGFAFSNWISNFISTLILVCIVVLTFFVGIKLSSILFNYSVEFSVWRLRHYFFSTKAKFPMNFRFFGLRFNLNNLHFGTILSLFLTLISNGLFYFTSIFTFSAKDQKKIGKDKVYLKDFTEMGISLISLFLVLFLIIVFKIIGIERGVIVGSWFIIWSLIPFGPLIGAKIFFGSRTLYIGTVAFMILFLSIVSAIPFILSLLIAVLFAFIILIVYFLKIEYS